MLTASLAAIPRAFNLLQPSLIMVKTQAVVLLSREADFETREIDIEEPQPNEVGCFVISRHLADASTRPGPCRDGGMWVS